MPHASACAMQLYAKRCEMCSFCSFCALGIAAIAVSSSAVAAYSASWKWSGHSCPRWQSPSGPLSARKGPLKPRASKKQGLKHTVATAYYSNFKAPELVRACQFLLCVCVRVHDVYLFHNYHELSHPVRSCTILFVHYDSGLFFVSCLWLRRLMLHVLLAVNDMRRCSSLKPGRSEPSCNTAETGSLLSFQSVI